MNHFRICHLIPNTDLSREKSTKENSTFSVRLRFTEQAKWKKIKSIGLTLTQWLWIHFDKLNTANSE